MFSLWLSWQELNGRRIIFFINVILVALLIALPVSLDLVGKARKTSVGTRIDYLGPSLILVPEGILSSDLVTARLKGRTFSTSTFDTVKRDLSPYLRSAEARLTERLLIDGRDMPVTGIDFQNDYSYPFTKYSPGNNEVLLGNAAADKLQKYMGDRVSIESEMFTIAGILPTSGEIDDVSVFISLGVLQRLTQKEGRINEIRLFPESASSYEELKKYIDARRATPDVRRSTFDGLNLIDAYRGDTAEKGVDSTLNNYRKALYTVAFILIAICIMISTYINLDGRKAEVSTVYTLGADKGIIFQILTLRTIWITLLGSFAGQILALAIAALQDLQVPLRLIWSAGSFIEVMLVTVFLGVLITIPFAFYSVYKRDMVEQL
jgi:ABC-type antimicrobial peptide transport system permease subunit